MLLGRAAPRRAWCRRSSFGQPRTQYSPTLVLTDACTAPYSDLSTSATMLPPQPGNRKLDDFVFTLTSVEAVVGARDGVEVSGGTRTAQS